MKRYDFYSAADGEEAEMLETSSGEWVRFEDVEELENRIAEATDLLDRVDELIDTIAILRNNADPTSIQAVREIEANRGGGGLRTKVDRFLRKEGKRR